MQNFVSKILGERLAISARTAILEDAYILFTQDFSKIYEKPILAEFSSDEIVVCADKILKRLEILLPSRIVHSK